MLSISVVQATPQQRAVSPPAPSPPSNPVTPPSHTDPITDDPDSPYLLPDNPTGVPLDGGISLLILGGALGGAAALRRKNRSQTGVKDA